MLGLAILGGGHGAHVHLPAARAVPGVEPVVLAARSRTDAFGIDRESDWRAAVERDDVDAVVVALPPALQGEAVAAAAAAGKPVLCEKPAGRSPDEAEAMLRACEAAEVVHAVGFQFRFEPAMAALRAQLAAGAVGPVDRIDVDWLVGAPDALTRAWSWKNDAGQGGGVTLNFASHAVDYLRWLTDAEPRLVYCDERIVVPARADATGESRRVSAPDRCDLVLALGERTVATLRISNVERPGLGHRITVHGKEGALELWFRLPFAPDNVTLLRRGRDGASAPLPVEDGDAAAAAGVARGGDSRTAATRRLLAAFAEAAAGRACADLATLADACAAHRVLAARRPDREPV